MLTCKLLICAGTVAQFGWPVLFKLRFGRLLESLSIHTYLWIVAHVISGVSPKGTGEGWGRWGGGGQDAKDSSKGKLLKKPLL